MAIKIAVANQKGGVGKTTTAINLADALSHFGNKVLFLDLDPQHNSTGTYGATMEGENTIVDVMKKDCTMKEAIQHTPLGDIVPGDALLAQEESYFDSRTAREGQLKRVLKEVDDLYDYIVMDTPPNLGIYMKNALTAADGCVIPIRAEKYAVDGLGLLVSTVNDVHEYLNPDLKIYGVVLAAYDQRNKLDRDILEALPMVGKQKGFHTFKTPIRISQDVKKVQSMDDSVLEDGTIEIANRSLFENYGYSNAAYDYVNFTKELLEVIANG